ncbi:MAG: HEAT repeat domain-containing protein, partial [Candidatus Brocadiales bacterium]|nr:HEAT repeat domain-containing protein [Candidatus Bathyanammoxibius sp.]
GTGSQTAIYYLCDALLHATNPQVRVNAALTLGNMGPRARDATTILAKALEDEDSDVRLAAAQALGSIGREALDAASALSKARRDPDMRVRKQAKESLMDIARGGR